MCALSVASGSESASFRNSFAVIRSTVREKRLSSRAGLSEWPGVSMARALGRYPCRRGTPRDSSSCSRDRAFRTPGTWRIRPSLSAVSETSNARRRFSGSSGRRGGRRGIDSTERNFRTPITILPTSRIAPGLPEHRAGPEGVPCPFSFCTAFVVSRRARALLRRSVSLITPAPSPSAAQR